MSYFTEIPLISYNNQLSRNIILKAAIVKSVLNKIDSFYNYIIPEGYRPDMVANDVYESPFYDWLVYLCNEINDPYYNWPIDYKDFPGYLEAKYYTDVYTLQSQIHHYKYTGLTNESPEQIALISWTMSQETYDILGAEDPVAVSGWTPVFTYDYENDLNDSRRSIKLISNKYLPQINKELSKVFK